MKRKIIVGFIIVVFGYAAFKAAGNLTNKNPAVIHRNEMDTIIPVSKTIVEERTLVSQINLTGEIEPMLRADISAKITGLIEEVRTSLGEFVSAGKTIVQINENEFKEQLNNANIYLQLAKVSLEKQKIEAENLKKQYDRSAELFNNDMVTKEELEMIETKYMAGLAEMHYQEVLVEQEKSRIEQAKIDLEYTIIKAPFSGFIENIYMEKGSLASPGKNILSVIAIEKVKIIVDVSEKYYHLIAKNMPVSFTITGRDDHYTGRISRISPSINPETRTAKVEIMVNNLNHDLRPGMTAMVSFEIERFIDIPSAPREALFKFEDQTGIFLINDDNTVKFIPITPAVINGEFMGFARKDGIFTGQRLVLLGGHLLKTGDKVLIDNGESDSKENQTDDK